MRLHPWLLAVALLPTAHAAPRVAVGKYFKGYTACFVLKRVGGPTLVRFNPKLAATRISPFSTFKIANSLIGLETGVAQDERHVYRWDGTRHPDRPELDHDLDMQTAFRLSAVWYYQRLATDIGPRRMQQYVDRIGYGNRDISGGQTKFWLGTSLRISANEQVALLERLYTDRLPLHPRTMHIVRKIMVADHGPGWELAGKTGSSGTHGGTSLGWYVGSVRSGAKRYVFACNLRAPKDAMGANARDRVRAILTEMSLIPRPTPTPTATKR